MIPLCRTAEIPESGRLPVTVEGLPELLVCRVGDAIHVVSNLCSHGASALSDGRMLGCEIECELHQGRFDVTTGQATRRPAKKPIATYAVVVEDGVVLLNDATDPRAPDGRVAAPTAQ
ncbi:non-heme iron oxygenase ferredoxin subunit [Streptomyces sp. NPDC050743]|uniref:non-heme iron oxygenase ferredoxin subunit n=1 Tax=Streptomyces sp. NPDC050743 TaxID=3365634 RepID=UPI0037B4576C